MEEKTLVLIANSEGAQTLFSNPNGKPILDTDVTKYLWSFYATGIIKPGYGLAIVPQEQDKVTPSLSERPTKRKRDDIKDQFPYLTNHPYIPALEITI